MRTSQCIQITGSGAANQSAGLNHLPADYETFVPSGNTSANQSAQLNIDAVPDYESIVFLEDAEAYHSADLSNRENIMGGEERGASQSAELSNPTPDYETITLTEENAAYHLAEPNNSLADYETIVDVGITVTDRANCNKPVEDYGNSEDKGESAVCQSADPSNPMEDNKTIVLAEEASLPVSRTEQSGGKL